MTFKTNALRFEFQIFVLTELLDKQCILFVGYLGVRVSFNRKTFLLKKGFFLVY